MSGSQSRVEPTDRPVVDADSGSASARPLPGQETTGGGALSGTELAPAEGYHLDDVAPLRTRPLREDKLPARRPIQLTLRSSPSGAVVSIDGVAIGRTPTVWEGSAASRAHEFTFVLRGYTMARYRFVPITSGVVHGTLSKIDTESGDAGVEARHGAGAPGD